MVGNYIELIEMITKNGCNYIELMKMMIWLNPYTQAQNLDL